jgi:hypothetical protein
MRIEYLHSDLKGVSLRIALSIFKYSVALLLCAFSPGRSSLVFAQKIEPPAYTLKQLDRLIDQHTESQLIMGYELGEVDWSQRVLRTVAVGTHTILSPTGGWGEHDLEALAVERARQKFERLSAEIFRHNLALSRCEWGTRSKLFQSQSPYWMSDGTVHLSSMIRFEIYESCPHQLDTHKSKTVDVISSIKRSPQALAQWLQSLENELSQHKRVIAYVDMSELSAAGSQIQCLQVNPRIFEVNTAKTLPVFWRATRWFWDRLSQTSSLKSIVKPAIYLGKVRCDQKTKRLILLNSLTKMKLQKLLERRGGVELWIWVKKNG